MKMDFETREELLRLMEERLAQTARRSTMTENGGRDEYFKGYIEALSDIRDFLLARVQLR